MVAGSVLSDAHPLRRRLATILAIDVAGYSQRVERDEAGALRDLAALQHLVQQIAASHSGRVFHTAGDGFMLEFATVTGALEAADAIRRQAGLPLRIGAHVGEVSVTDDDDLLGHGVNVAARLQAKAPLNGVLVSGDIVRAERGDFAQHFSPCGRIRLDKMRETLPVFVFDPSAEPRSAWRRGWTVRRLAPWILTVLVVGSAVPLIWIAGRHALGADNSASAKNTTQELRVAVQDFHILGDADGDLRKFTGGLQSEIIGQLSQSQINVAEPNQASEATYSFAGAAEKDGAELLVHIRLDDVHQHVTVWSEEFHGPLKASATLQSEVAALASHVANQALETFALAKGDPETASMLIKSDLYALRNTDQDREAEWQNDKQIVQRLPNDWHVHADLAIVSAFLAATSDPQRAAELKALATSEAKIALKIKPRADSGYLAQFLAFPLVGHWREREAILLEGLRALPQSPVLTNHESNLLREVGRLNEAVFVGRQAAAPKPPSANREATLLLALAATGQAAETSSVAEILASTWPKHPATWNGRLQTMIFQARWEDAVALFRPGAYPPATLSSEEQKAWVEALEAMKSGNAKAKRQAASAFAALPSPHLTITQPPHEIYAPSVRIGMLAVLGASDEAFVEADSYLRKEAYADSSFLFWPNLSEFRRDPRFLQLVTRIGLVDYWRETGKRPDFCAEGQPPFDCRLLAH